MNGSHIPDSVFVDGGWVDDEDELIDVAQNEMYKEHLAVCKVCEAKYKIMQEATRSHANVRAIGKRYGCKATRRVIQDLWSIPPNFSPLSPGHRSNMILLCAHLHTCAGCYRFLYFFLNDQAKRLAIAGG